MWPGGGGYFTNVDVAEGIDRESMGRDKAIRGVVFFEWAVDPCKDPPMIVH